MKIFLKCVDILRSFDSSYYLKTEESRVYMMILSGSKKNVID